MLWLFEYFQKFRSVSINETIEKIFALEVLTVELYLPLSSKLGQGFTWRPTMVLKCQLSDVYRLWAWLNSIQSKNIHVENGQNVCTSGEDMMQEE